ncbi:MAG: hypothetical protein AVDCRST_MAG77-1489 [uncultured Chloroflexi bacterium]|uniref:Uncharacterized protein n=1 Tax=uncultured Chloroflexota bacterium TaxID=166587 RepID=A0A6J4HX41_9CHLR|nr:MAG: hypothetical protein AVDCRST_MAG77-1489 [uncultured Chloroflexota bacterium]
MSASAPASNQPDAARRLIEVLRRTLLAQELEQMRAERQNREAQPQRNAA